MVPQIKPERVVRGWGQGEDAPELGLVSTVATDSRGAVYVLCRAPYGVMHVFAAGGQYLRSWAYPFVQPHGLWIGPDDRVLTTELGDQTVRIFTTEGELLQTIGKPGVTGEPGMPFNGPTRAVVGPSGDVFVSDGYGQNRVHRFTADGRLVRSWGEAGTGPGQFDTPHSLWVDVQEQVYVVDRANSRVQVFEGDGEFIEAWTGLCWPHDIFVTADGLAIVTDCAPREQSETRPYHEVLPSKPIAVFRLNGELVARSGVTGDGTGLFLDCPHALWIDAEGDVYVSEVITPNRLHKFAKAG